MVIWANLGGGGTRLGGGAVRKSGDPWDAPSALWVDYLLRYGGLSESYMGVIRYVDMYSNYIFFISKYVLTSHPRQGYAQPRRRIAFDTGRLPG